MSIKAVVDWLAQTSGILLLVLGIGGLLTVLGLAA